jgi:flagellar hook-length control protein FliK
MEDPNSLIESNKTTEINSDKQEETRHDKEATHDKQEETTHDKEATHDKETTHDKQEETKPVSDDDINVLSGPNDVDVAIRPDVKDNRILIQFCSCSVIFSCFRS